MAVHLPLSAEAQAEARILMLSSNNILSRLGSPAGHAATGHGDRVVLPDHRIPGDTGEFVPAAKDRPESGVYASPSEAIMGWTAAR